MSSEVGADLDAATDAGPAATPVVRAAGLGKRYQVYARPQDRLWQMLWRGRKQFYREFPAVSGVDLEVHHGETVGIVGRNGSGKSTLLQMICGTLEPTEGELHVDGRIAPLLTLGAGFNRNFTGRENVIVNAAILGMTDEEIESRMDAIRDFADIGEFFDQPVKAYSTGMYSRLAFAVAVNCEPDLLVIDEVLAVGDEAFNRKCFARIEEIKRSGATVLFVSHSATWVVELCDRAVLMERGERLLTGSPKTVIARYKRLIHAPDRQVPEITQEIRELDRKGESAQDPVAPAPREPTALATSWFDPALVPESTVDFPTRGARISNPRILGPDGEAVNVLRAGEVYAYAYEVEFLDRARAVRFGMLVKSVNGIELGGQVSHRAGSGVEEIEAGSRAAVQFRFRAALAPGAYFLNAGVLAESLHDETYLHRILDAVMFRVLVDDRGCVTGRVDLSPVDGEPVELTID